MNWTGILKPVIFFSLTKFFYKRLKEYTGPKSNILTIDECKSLANIYNLKLDEISKTNIVTFSKI